MVFNWLQRQEILSNFYQPRPEFCDIEPICRYRYLWGNKCTLLSEMIKR